MPKRRRGRFALGVALGIVVFVGGLVAAHATGLFLHDSATAASIQEAVNRFRESNPNASELEGVYVYETSGSESIDALGGAHHLYPAETVITASAVSCGLKLRWDALEKRSTTWTLRATTQGFELRTSDEVHQFFGQTDRTVYTCEKRALLPARRPVGLTRSFTCRTQKGAEAGDVRIIGRERLHVGGDRVEVVHVRMTTRMSGENSGVETIDWWLDAHSALPVRIVLSSRTARKLFVGTVHYREDVDLRLASTKPRR